MCEFDFNDFFKHLKCKKYKKFLLIEMEWNALPIIV